MAFVMFGAEFLFAILQQFAYNKPTNEIFDNLFEMVFSIIGVELIKFMMLLLFKQMPKASEVKIEWKVFAAYFVMPLTMLLIMLQIPYLREKSVLDESEDIRLIILFLLMLLGNLLLFYFFREYQNTKETELVQHVELTKYQEKLKFHEEIEILNEEYSVLIHNIKHYLKQIGNYAADSSNDEIINVLRQLQIEVFDKNQATICTNRLLNSILTDFKVNCQKHKIKAEILVEPECRIEFMKEIDAMAMFGNLLDNALEAADKCEQGWVKVEMFRQNAGAILVLKIQNNYVTEIKESKGELISSKTNGKNHGMGVKSVRRIVQKYNGIFDIKYGNGVFEVSAIFTN